MEFALGVLKWSPDRFWKATFYEISCAYVGHSRAEGTGYFAKRPDGWTAEGIDKFREKTAKMRERFPDTPPPKGAKHVGRNRQTDLRT